MFEHTRISWLYPGLILNPLQHLFVFLLDGVYKCQDCLGEPLYCTGCCRSQHRSNPFHWISQWNGRFFKQSCLAHVGLIIYLGHDGKQCPAVTDRWNLFEEDEPEDLLEPEDLPFVSGSEFQPKENTMVIVDKSGVHRLEVRCCECPNAMSPDIQMPKTVFTFRVLNDFLLDSLECSTSAMNYYSKLQVAQQWRQLKTMKWHGFGHCSDNPSTGELALFCPACPQPGINVLLDPSWKYTWSFLMDGNFKAKHLHPIKPFNEDRYKMHLAEAADTVEKSSCKNHWAVNQANAAQHKLESTGIGGVACARHSCFVPHSMVDFQKGITRAVTFYDINCQYNKHFQVQVDQSQFLEMAPQLTIIPGIGCYINREIMEMLWARLNLISPAAWGISSPHRKECLNYQMNDSNFCKMIHMKRTLCWKYELARNGILESGKAFDRLNKATPSHLKTEWLARKRIAQSSRLNDPSAMNEYEINIKKGTLSFIVSIKQKEIELRLLEEGNTHNVAPSCRSVATWISTGLAIDEAQIALLIKLQKIRRRSTKTQRLDITHQ
ncbi:hypothetical protein BDR06DRAFT_980938 [Suillus hirtellus]|nr:hypothetical protein BDR06DRAFT_980938 [Suillus hirtellus]